MPLWGQCFLANREKSFTIEDQRMDVSPSTHRTPTFLFQSRFNILNVQAQNMMDHEAEIYSRPKREWFQSTRDKRMIAAEAKAAKDGTRKRDKDQKVMSVEDAEEKKRKEKRKREREKNMTRKQRRRLEAEREDAEDMQDEDNSQQDDDEVTRFPFMFFSQGLPRQFHHNVGCDQ
jgi:hypothetical protein